MLCHSTLRERGNCSLKGMDMVYLCAWHTQNFGHSNIYKSSVDHRWKPLTKMVIRLLQDKPGAVSHGICDDCSEIVSKEIDAEELRRKYV